MVPPDHDYLSTACLHNQHDYCQADRGRLGPKTPGVCKFCSAPCQCDCHAPAIKRAAAAVASPLSA